MFPRNPGFFATYRVYFFQTIDTLYLFQAGAAAAVLKQDQSTVHGRVINVALSNPPKKQRQGNEQKPIRQEGR